MKANIHSFETMGLHDGPGIRTVIFFQGCPLRCKYCHNPDSWSTKVNKEFSVDQLLQKVIPYKNYYSTSNGGVTLSGGEPLLQTEFIIEFAKRLKEENIHVTLDTSGIGSGNYNELLKYVDLVMLDIKHPEKKGFFEITRRDNSKLFRFIEDLNKSKTSVWIRNVIVNKLNDTDEYLRELKKFILKIDKIERIELLPFHKMCLEKYDNMGIEFPLKDTEETKKSVIIELENKLKNII